MLTAQEFRQKTLAELQPTAGEIPLDSQAMRQRLSDVSAAYSQRTRLASTAGLVDQIRLLEIDCCMARAAAAGFRPISRGTAACLASGVPDPTAVSWSGNTGSAGKRGYSITTTFGTDLPPDAFSFRVEYPIVPQTTSVWRRWFPQTTTDAVEIWRADIVQFATLLPDSVLMLLAELRPLQLFSGIAVYAPPKYFKAGPPVQPKVLDPVVVGVVGPSDASSVAKNFQTDAVREFFIASWL